MPWLLALLLLLASPAWAEEPTSELNEPLAPTAEVPAQEAPPAETPAPPPETPAEVVPVPTEEPPAGQAESPATPAEVPVPPSPEESAAQQAPPEPPKRKRPEWESPFHSSRWPGAFVGLRTSFAMGALRVPRFGPEGLTSAQQDIGQMAPYLGIEMGKVPQRWGGSFSLETTFLSTPAAYLGQSPFHLALALNVIRQPRDSKFRWMAGFEPYVTYVVTYPTGQTLEMRAFGFKAESHYLLKKWSGSFLEAFASLTYDRITEVAAGFDSNTKNYPVSTFTGGGLNYIFLAYLGLELSLSW
ncbi:MAG TPA: hypothetical protein VL588_11460 [Bdellovibrionota bacterium]|jgi:hypothetical protein|nr:hypothetical protein [Bdellovibrionota bacterium]